MDGLEVETLTAEELKIYVDYHRQKNYSSSQHETG